MSNRPQVEIENLNKLVRALKKAGEEDLLELIKEANKEAADTVESAARPRVPKRTGRLLQSLRSSATPRASYVRVGKARVPYAGVIHFGWPRRGIRPQPFLFTALDSRRSEVVGIFEDRIAALAARIEAGE